jgi:uncharacterized protein (DUF488 family)
VFVAALDAWGIDLVVDVRFLPRSARNPAFSERNLRETLGSRYSWDGKRLGNPAKFGGVSIEPGSRAAGIDDLEHAIRAGRTVAIMCSEGRPEKCHRSGIAAELALRGMTVVDVIVSARSPGAAPVTRGTD